LKRVIAMCGSSTSWCIDSMADLSFCIFLLRKCSVYFVLPIGAPRMRVPVVILQLICPPQ